MKQGQVFRERVEKGKFYGENGVLSSTAMTFVIVLYILLLVIGTSVVYSTVDWPFGTSFYYTVSVVLSIGCSTPNINPLEADSDSGFYITTILVLCSVFLIIYTLAIFLDYYISFAK